MSAMKAGAENRKKTIIAGGLGVAALICLGYLYNTLFGGPNTPPPAPAPAPVVGSTNGTRVDAPSAAVAAANAKALQPGGGTAGVAATKLASTSASLDPTLDDSAMLRTESLVYSGTGRNIFSLVYVAPVVIEKPKAPARPIGPPPPPPPPPVYQPPPPPPINLKFFGTIKRGGAGKAQAFVLDGEDVYLASEGDIVARKYKIVSISNNTIQVTDLQNNNTQTLPLQMN